ncbi:hypothetical protein L228DRAFT_213575 [Xylona heveae TC161]|uniref:SMP-LTD domain-containing protein n=1 Tax=Xylona heveae (strain CBS 132557 / TC161) TaxID=1328760 RepID=A0A165AHN4_XYLHT|nr:hypothetical protein L228DRAFT_213575 [Xylona heveae TC161]KZF20490.1 hypothetical protein L228DRAFT_213575 [Xylona heveae TC161]
MGPIAYFLVVYALGGLTFLPLLLAALFLHAYLTFPIPQPTKDQEDSLALPNDDPDVLTSSTPNLADEFKASRHEPDVAAGYFAVCREYVPGGVNGKPPERTTPAGETVVAESPSVYQSMYRSIFDRSKTPSLDAGKGAGNASKKARNVFFVVLRLGHLMLYDDAEQLEVRHVISLAHHDVSIYAGGNKIPDGELWIKRNAICLTRKQNVVDMTSQSKPFFLFSENTSEKEDFYFALLQNQERRPQAQDNAPAPQKFEVKHIVKLVQLLHSSEEHLQISWFNALIGRLFLALYKTAEVEDFVRMKITKKIARVKKPTFLTDIVIRKIEMGEAAPSITNPRLKELTVDGDCCIGADLDYSGNFRLEIETTARIDLGSRIKPREVKLVLALVLKKLQGHVLIRFKPPPSNRLWFSFESMPKMEMSIAPVVSSRQITYGFILRAIESRIREVFAETLVFPHWDDAPFTDTSRQKFRGGIWADDQSVQAPETKVDKAAEEGEVEKTMSMPTLFSNDSQSSLSQVSSSRKARNDTSSPLPEPKDVGVSSGSEPRSPTQKPRGMRTHSFASSATPVVGMDTTTVDAVKNDTSKSEKPDATSVMIAISSRSQPGSPTATPVGSPPKCTPLSQAKDISRALNFSNIDNAANNLPSTESTQTDWDSGSHPPSPPSFATTRSTSIASESSLKEPSRTPSMRSNPTTEKRQALASIGSATAAAAKKWGWGVLGRSNERKPSFDGVDEGEKLGTPAHPIGRGRPLPPPGTPLPPPDRRSSTNPLPIPKRKPLPPPALPQRNQSKSSDRPVPPPPLPARQLKGDGPKDTGNEGELLVVAAPLDSEPSSPLLEDQDETPDTFKLDEDLADGQSTNLRDADSTRRSSVATSNSLERKTSSNSDDTKLQKEGGSTDDARTETGEHT